MGVLAQINKTVTSIEVTAAQDIFSNFSNGNVLTFTADVSTSKVRGSDLLFYYTYNHSGTGLSITYSPTKDRFQINPTDASEIFLFDKWNKESRWQDRSSFTSSSIASSGSNNLIYQKGHISFLNIDSNINFHTE